MGGAEIRLPLCRVTTALRSWDDDTDVVVRDAANWIKGCSSLDSLRVAVLLAVKSHKSGGGSLCLIDVKETTAAVAPRHTDIITPRATMPN